MNQSHGRGTARIVRDQPGACKPFDWSTPPEDPPPAPAAIEPEPPALPEQSFAVVDIGPLENRIQELERLVDVRSKEAYRRGQEEIRAALQKQTEDAVRNLRDSVEDLNSRKKKIFDEADVSLVQLALAIARRVLHRELTISPEALHGLVAVAMERIRSQELLRVHTHPSHEQMIRKALASITNSTSIEVLPSDNLAPGGLKFETRQGFLDTSVDTQLAEIENGLTDHLKRMR